MTIGEIIKQRRLELGYTLEYIGQATGVGKSTVKKWESGKISNMKRNRIQSLSQILKLDPNVFINEAETEQSHEPTLTELSQKFSEIQPVAVKRVPLVATVACGQPIFAEQDYDTSVNVGVPNEEVDFAFTCFGDSMEPNYHNGNIVFVQRQNFAENGEVVVAVIDDNDITLKRLYKDDKNKTLSLCADNPMYKPMIFSGSEAEERVRILGIAISVHGKAR